MVVLYFYHPSGEKPNLPLAVQLLRNSSEAFSSALWVWVATSTAAGNVSSASTVNSSLFSPEVDRVFREDLKKAAHKCYSNFLNEFPSLSVY